MTDDAATSDEFEDGLPRDYLLVLDTGAVEHLDSLDDVVSKGVPLFAVRTPHGFDLWCVEQRPEDRGPGAKPPRPSGVGYTVDGGVLAVKRGQDVLRAYSPSGWLNLTMTSLTRATG